MSLKDYKVCSTINADCIDESSVSYLLKKLYEGIERELRGRTVNASPYPYLNTKVEEQKAYDSARCENCNEYFGPDNCPWCSCKVKKR